MLCRPEAVGDLLQLALPVLMAGLQDKDDSVQAAAAEALVPLAPMLLQMQAEDVSAQCGYLSVCAANLCAFILLCYEYEYRQLAAVACAPGHQHLTSMLIVRLP